MIFANAGNIVNKDTIDMIIAILGFLGVTSVVSVIIIWNHMNLMNPIRFTFEEIDKRENYIFFITFIKTLVAVILASASLFGSLLVYFFLKLMK